MGIYGYLWVYRGMYGYVLVSGQVENWKIIKLEIGKVENCKSVKLESCQSGKVENFPLFHF